MLTQNLISAAWCRTVWQHFYLNAFVIIFLNFGSDYVRYRYLFSLVIASKKKKKFPVQMRTAQPWPARWGWNEPIPTPGPSSPRCPKPVYKHQQQWTLNSGDHSRLCSLVNSKFSTWVNTCFGLKNLWIFYRDTGRLENELIWNFFLCFCENDTVIPPLYFLRNVWTAVVNIIGCKNCWDSDKSLAFLVFFVSFFLYIKLVKIFNYK